MTVSAKLPTSTGRSPLSTFLVETFMMGLKNLRLHKLRSFLTVLGIIFGVGAVIVMVAIGEGHKLEALRQLDQLGATNIVVRSIKPPDSSDTSQQTQRILEYGIKRIDEQRIGALPNIVRVVPIRDTEQRVVVGAVRANANALGTTPEVFRVIRLDTVRDGRSRTFTWTDYDQKADVCVIGHGVSKQLFPYGDPVGQRIQVGSSQGSILLLTVIGVLEPTGLRSENNTMIERDLDQDIYFPLSLAEEAFGDAILTRKSGSFERKIIERSELWIEVPHREDVEPQTSVIANIMRMRVPNEQGYVVKAPLEILHQAERTQKQFNLVMGGIASISLLVGGIGIMNIMLANVTERTREIGIRRAMGAKRRHITLQFLIETTVISLAGGFIGVAVGCGLSLLLPIIVSGMNTSITFWSVAVSFGFSGLIGIGFGLYPAVMAARKNPIEALRHE